MGVAIEDKSRPCVFAMVLDGAFDEILLPYQVQTIASNVELKFDRLVELLESPYIESERQ